MVNSNMYKGSAQRAANAALSVRTGKDTTKCEVGRNKRPMIWCNERYDNAKSYLFRAVCPVLCCALVGNVTF